MKNYNYASVIKYTIVGILSGLMLVVNAFLLNRQRGFDGPWYHIFDYSPDFIIIILSPAILGLLFCFIGIRWQQLVAFNSLIKRNLTQEQVLGAMAEKHLRLLGKVVAQLDQAISITDNSGSILWINEGFTKVTGYTLKEVIGKNPQEFLLIHDNENKLTINYFDGKPFDAEVKHRKKNGEDYWASLSIKPTTSFTGKVTNYIIIECDISARKEKELMLENEIVERKELQLALLANKKKLEKAIEISRFGTWEAITAENKLHISNELRAIYNLAADAQLTIQDLFKNTHPDDIKEVWKSIQLAAKGEANETEFRCVIDGAIKYMLSNVAPRYDNNKELVGYVGTIKDISRRKNFELAIKKSEAEKDALLNSTHALICMHDNEGIILNINAAVEKQTGYTRNELIGTNIRGLMPKEYQAQFKEYLTQVSENSNASGYLQIITKEGKKRIWMYQNACYNNKGEAPYIIASGIDVTESIKAKSELERQSQLINQIIENSPNLIYLINQERQVVLCNKAFCTNYNFSDKEKPFVDEIIKSEEDIFIGDSISLLEMEDGESVRIEGSVADIEGNSKWYNIIKKCFRDKRGNKYILCIGMDITNRHQIETDLLAANEIVERSLKVKDQFIANISHEIRTPLNAVIGFTDLLTDTELKKEQGEYVEIIKTASQNLLALINNVLDLSKIEAGGLVLHEAPIDVKQTITDAVKLFEPKAKGKGLQLQCSLDGGISDKLVADQLRISQILYNLIGNAIKFTHEGKIDILCKKVSGSDARKEYISFTITDTGIGVAQEMQEQIFERFVQENKDTDRLYGGAGLGLNIAKGIVDMYGGSLLLQSEPGIGSTFNFILGFDKCVDEENLSDSLPLITKKCQLPNGVNINILLVEDNKINAALAKQVLNNAGFTLTHVHNGAEAIDMVQQQKFDVVLMDIQMPVMNGIEATQAIRALNGNVSQIPIIAMTAHSLYGEIQNCYKSGMNGYVVKPFKCETLFTSIMEFVPDKRNNILT